MSYVDELFGIAGRTAVLTGAGGHLCGEMSRAYGRAGCNVV